MKIHEHYSHWLPKLLLNRKLHHQYSAITIFNHILYSSTPQSTPSYIRAHERVHLKQIFLDHWHSPISFYHSYLYQWVTHHLNYLSIPFEIEAYTLQFSPQYQPNTFDPAFKQGKLPNLIPPI